MTTNAQMGPLFCHGPEESGFVLVGIIIIIIIAMTMFTVLSS